MKTAAELLIPNRWIFIYIHCTVYHFRSHSYLFLLLFFWHYCTFFFSKMNLNMGIKMYFSTQTVQEEEEKKSTQNISLKKQKWNAFNVELKILWNFIRKGSLTDKYICMSLSFKFIKIRKWSCFYHAKMLL